MKIPKKLRVFGYDWKVIYDKKNEDDYSSGAFKWKVKEIHIHTEYGDEENLFIHEIMEAVLVELGYRFYGQEKSMEYQFHFDHSGFVRFHSMFFQILKDNKLI